MACDDFVVTAHAFERFEQRFPGLCFARTDVEQANFIHSEVMDALECGRRGTVPPIQLSTKYIERWQVRAPGAYFVWTADKKRGYLIREDDDEGMLVVTVIASVPMHQAKRRLTRLNR